MVSCVLSGSLQLPVTLDLSDGVFLIIALHDQSKHCFNILISSHPVKFEMLNLLSQITYKVALLCLHPPFHVFESVEFILFDCG